MLISFSFLAFYSSFMVVIQTYEYRSFFVLLEELKEERESQISHYNFLSEEISYLKSQNTINKIAREGMQMISPKRSSIIIVNMRD
jgi:cell division protein FtsL